MSVRYRVGVASVAGGRAMASYLSREALSQSPEQVRLAHYYAGQERAPTPADGLVRLVNDGVLSYSEAEGALVGALLGRPENRDVDPDLLEARATNELKEAMARHDEGLGLASPHAVTIKVQPDMDPALADVLGVGGKRTLTVDEHANFLSALRADDGGVILGKERHKAMISIVEAFGLDPRAPPEGDAVHNVLAGRRADGEAPHTPKGEPLSEAAIAGARRRYLSMMGVPSGREPTAEEIGHLVAGRTAGGLGISASDYRRKANNKNESIAYVELVFAPDKTVSISWALARTEAERAAWMQVHEDAVLVAMRYSQTVLGHAGIGKNRDGGTEPAKLGWVGATHFTSRPTVETIAYDAEGRAYTEPREVPVAAAPQLHTHVNIANVLRTESGRLTSIDLDRLDGEVAAIRSVYQAGIARGARALGADVVIDDRTGAARLAAIPDSARSLFSGRRGEGEASAREYAAERGLDWDDLSEARKRSLLEAGIIESRKPKAAGEGVDDSNFTGWEKRAIERGYSHRSPMRPDEIKPELAAEMRHELAYRTALPILADALERNVKIGQGDLKEMVARSLIVSGFGNPEADIAAVTGLLRERGVEQDGRATKLIAGEDVPVRGKQRIAVTTALHVEQEERLIALARKAHADHSPALSLDAIARAADHSALDLSSEHGQQQRAMMEAMATGPLLVVSIGAAGSGKTSILRPVVEAWKAAGEDRTVFGAALAHRQASPLVGAGIDERHKTAIDPFLRRAESGKYALDAKSLVVIDEVGQLGTRQLLRLLELQDRHGFKIVAVGDPAQCAAIEAGAVIDLVRKAIGKEAVPEILTTVRQKHEHERRIATLFRDGRAEEALAIKRDDGTAILVAGGQQRTVNKVADIWAERMAANKDDASFRLTVTTRSNENVLAIGEAIRVKQREMGLIGKDEAIWQASDKAGNRYELPLAVGDRVRVFDRIYTKGADGKRIELVNNGDVAAVRRVSKSELLVRNGAGIEGVIRRDKIEGRDGRVRLSYGTVLTVDAAQGVTSTVNINALIDGTRGITSLKNYVSESRHEQTSIMVIDEMAERRDISSRQPRGIFKDIREPDVWDNVARNLSRIPEKESATRFLAGSVERMRDATRVLQLGMEPEERRQRYAASDTRAPLLSRVERFRHSLPHAIEQVRKIAHIAHERLRPRQRMEMEMPDRGLRRGMGISR